MVLTHENLSSSNSYRSGNIIDLENDFDLTTEDSLQWDHEGTDLISSSGDLYPTDLLAVANLNHLLPLRLDQYSADDDRSSNLDQYPNRDEEFTEFTVPGLGSHQRRLLPRRRTLPLELEQKESFLQSFLRRLNPFKKKSS